MTTKELIERLTELDPEGNREVRMDGDWYAEELKDEDLELAYDDLLYFSKK